MTRQRSSSKRSWICPGWRAARTEVTNFKGHVSELAWRTVVVEAANPSEENGRLTIFFLSESGQLLKEVSRVLEPGHSTTIELHAADFSHGATGWLRVHGTDDLVISGFAIAKRSIWVRNPEEEQQELSVEDSRTLLFQERPFVAGSRPVAAAEGFQAGARPARPLRGG